MGRIYDWLASPGAKGPISDSAHTQIVAGHPFATSDIDIKATVVETTSSLENTTGYLDKAKDRRLDRWLDAVVRASGSQPVFLFILFGLLAWALAGIKYGNTESWPVVISDVQAILSYLFDSLLMRQQFNTYDQKIRLSASLRSRDATHERLIRQIHTSSAATPIDKEELERRFQAKAALEGLPAESWLGRLSTYLALAMGHAVSLVLYWVAMAIWIAFGPSLHWSDRWQLYINSATSALMVLIFCFLANIRERHAAYSKIWLNCLFEVDTSVERKLRTMTQDATPNEVVTVPGPKMGRMQRAIFYYADFVGTLTGVAILIVVIIAWLAIGPVMEFNSNWWLLIGTYAGLIGLHDGFVLRNIQLRLGQYEDAAFDTADAADVALLNTIGASDPSVFEMRGKKQPFSTRFSEKMGNLCAHEIAVILDVILILGLVIGASAQRWTVTGQLLCNVPPSIIETFIMLILITGHNLAEERHREAIHGMYLRRLKLLAYVEMLEAGGDAIVAEKA
ncbi:hypothetical protein NQ176_g2659 [Zarea fungicola]|uniref:Uncharacterized protein n=1 Tax=Zarea fungicola TaxID=93591 RepID=A0ACC1NM64_9HYPO|nr:hypothetical protein NQ176_g2659 [Lecanicillium fungicola]